MGQVLQLAVQLTQEDCGECGGVFAVNTTYRQRCYDEGKKTFACPYCKTDWGWTGRGALQVAQQALAAEKERLRLALAPRERRAGAEGQTGAEAEAREARRLPRVQPHLRQPRPPHALQARRQGNQVRQGETAVSRRSSLEETKLCLGG